MNVALLRGVNLGGKNLLPMSVLVEIFVNAGCANVRTYIQSGNVIFDAPKEILGELPRKIADQIAERFGFGTSVLLRTKKQLGEIIRNNPDEKLLHVFFLSDLPQASALGKLDTHRSAPDAFTVIGREIYVHFPNGMARTKLTNAYLDSNLAVTSTARNWRTVLKLYELL